MFRILLGSTVKEFYPQALTETYTPSITLSASKELDPEINGSVYVSSLSPITSRRCILNIYSTNILTEYFKHAA
jgi:hypothetical protein